MIQKLTYNNCRNSAKIAETFSIVIVIIALILSSIPIKNGYAIPLAAPQPSSSNQGGKVFVMYAGSLVKIFEKDLGPAFQTKTGYTYTGEGRGSLQIANMILDGQRRPDVFVSAGTIPINKLINSTSIISKSPLTQGLVKFASGEMVIAYLPTSKFHTDLDKAKKGLEPWYQVLSEQGFKLGRTDPDLDPKGYYTILMSKLANSYYKDPNIKQRILGDDKNPKQLFPEETLITTLETGHLDAIVAYKHEAVARGLEYIALPPQINLGNPSFSNFYKTATYTLPSGQTVHGEPIYFSVTIPNTYQNLAGAKIFVKFLLSPDGSSILQRDGLDHISPVIQGHMRALA
ncbi:MAG: extracellular solute-binding protein [Nitrososphaeraceae archaeon]